MHNFTQTKTTTANQLVLYHECVFQNEMQQLQAYVVRYWNCIAIMNSAVTNLFWHCTLNVLCIHYPYMDRFTQAKPTTANQLVLYHACFAAPGARTVKHMVLGWNCVAIMNSTAANCLTLYLACFAVRNSTANCSVMCLPWPYSKCIHCL